MHATEPLTDAIERIRDQVRDGAAALDPDQLAWQVQPGANPIGWLLWHLTRVQDAHVAEFLDQDQLYVSDGWAEALGLAPDDRDSGYGHTPEQVAAVRIEDPDRLVAYHDAVAARSLALLGGLSDADLDVVVDESWDPPVTAGVRWMSIIEDCFEHLGQAGYVRGLLP
ncbi:mycothiol transferase [Dermatobacter hominis]|uniref:mycothiol transferase n=1 Tax=Dermatobacter hominis TaxID=2884263 RepID=UPI001D1297DE|nr:DinB family protein [Dermatobacter hominis]UDY35107.1 DinB family protein [Dermatobacter hominis]